MSIGILVEVLYNRLMADKLFWNISKLRNWDKNPRAIKADKFQELKNRIKKYGQFKPVIATIDGEVIGGNMRLRAMKDLDMQDIWVSVVEPKTEAEKVEIALADNEEMGYYQEDQLAELISSYKDEIKLESFSIHLGDGVNLDDLLNKYQPEEVIEDEAPEVEEEAVSELGAIYQLGKHRVMCGDSTSETDALILFENKKADILFTSPPYNAGKSESLSGNTHSKDNKYMDGYKDENPNWDKLVINSLRIGMNYTNYQFYNIQQLAGNKIQFIEFLYQMRENFVDVSIWNKEHTAPAMAENVMNSQFEYILIFSKENKPSRAVNTANFRGTVSNVFNSQPQRKNEFSDKHSATFPLALPEYFIKNFTEKGMSVYDNFGGTGTTIIVCEQLDRQCYMMELDPRYVDVIRKRYAKFIGKENEWQEVTPRIN